MSFARAVRLEIYAGTGKEMVLRPHRYVNIAEPSRGYRNWWRRRAAAKSRNRRARAEVSNPDNEAFASIASCWEHAIVSADRVFRKYGVAVVW
jgi:hypothetical protein